MPGAYASAAAQRAMIQLLCPSSSVQSRFACAPILPSLTWPTQRFTAKLHAVSLIA
jgi:hypothetical protein